MLRTLTSVLSLGLVALGLTNPASAVDWTTLQRSATSFLTVSTSEDFAFANDMGSSAAQGLFSASVAADTSIAGVAGDSQAMQETTISFNGIVGSGTVNTATSVTNPDGFADVFGQSLLNAYFDVTAPVEYSLTGFITRGGDASARLFLMDGTAGFLVDAMPSADETIPLDASGTLQPGPYLFSVNVGGYAQETSEFQTEVSGSWTVNLQFGGATAVPVLAAETTLRVFPNPVRDVATISLAAPRAGSTVQIHDLAGRLVRSLESTDTVRWDTRDAAGRRVPTGIYFVQMRTPDTVQSGRVTVIR